VLNESGDAAIVVPAACGEPPSDGVHYFVQLMAFDIRDTTATSTAFRSWTTWSRDVAVARLRVYVGGARSSMSRSARSAALEWITSEQAAQQVRDTLARGAMYVHVFADRLVAYEITARPVTLPTATETRVGTWTDEDSAQAATVTGWWSW
jgi:hypothetical protein